VRIGAYSFAPRLWPTFAAALLIALTLWLGRWQTHRGDEKEVRQALFEGRIHETAVQLTGFVESADPILFRRVRAEGAWIEDGQIFVDNQVEQGRAGFQVVTPLRLAASGDVVLVNRGWIARPPDYPNPPRVAVPAGAVTVTGLATLPPRRVLELGPSTIAGNVWQNLSIERYRDRMKMRVLPIVVLADQATPGLVTQHEVPDAGVAKHREYALTWFSLATLAFVLWVALNVRKIR
jgi:surfeit locus 1 family protein